MFKMSRKSGLLETYSLILIDIIGILISYEGALLLRFGRENTRFDDIHYALLAIALVISLLYSVLTEWNRGFFVRGYFVEFIAILKYDLVLAISMSSIAYIIKAEQFSRYVYLAFAIFNLAVTYVLHLLFKRCIQKYYSKSASSDKVMIVTESAYAEKVVGKIMARREWNYSVTAVALVDREEVGEDETICDVSLKAGGNRLFDTARQLPLDEVFVYLPGYDIEKVKEIISDFETMGITCHYSVDIPELNLDGKTAGNFAGYAVLTFSLNYLDYRRVLIKRVFDIIGSLIGLSLTAVVTPFVALAIKLESKGPVFFKQVRIGKNGRRFKLYKFRSMYVDAEERRAELSDKNEMNGLMFKMENDPRITKVGRFIRKTSIDEMPQFLNILKGDMSLVGTRPPTVDEFERYSIYYRRRLSITPGLTGMWQVSGRNEIYDFDEVVKLDLMYIENWSLLLDVKIILQTIGVVLFHRGAR